MARPPDADSAKTLDSIREAAKNILNEEGPEGLSFRKVAKAAGVGVGTVRYYFASQEELLEACLDGFQDDLIDLERQWVNIVLEADDPREAVRNTVQAACAMVWTRQPLLRLRMVATIKQGGLNPARVRTVRDPFYKNASVALAEKTGRSEDNMRMVVDTVMRLVGWYGACSGEELCNVTGRDSVEEAQELLREHCADVAVRLVFDPPAPVGES